MLRPGNHEDSAWSLLGLAATNLANGEGEHGAMLLGAARAVLTQMGADFKPFERRLHEATKAEATALCGPTVHAAARDRGASLTLPAAVGLALDGDVPSV